MCTSRSSRSKDICMEKSTQPDRNCSKIHSYKDDQIYRNESQSEKQEKDANSLLMDKASSSQSTKYSLLQQAKSNLVLDLINLPSDQHIEKLSQFLTDIVQASISGAADFVTLENVKIFLQYVRQNAQLTLSEILVALQTLEILLQKSKEKGRTIVNTDNLGTALVCVCGLVLKFLRDQPYKNSWWSNAFSMDIHTLAESELVILEVMDWQIWINEKNFIRFAQRVVQGDKLFKS